MFWKRLGLLSSVPLAVTLSFLPNRFVESSLLPGSVLQSASANLRPHDAEGTAVQSSLEQNAKQLHKMLIENGYNEKLAQKAVAYAACATDLNNLAYVWQKGERLSGIFLISDSKQAACGHSALETWQFRALMQNNAAAANCRAKLEKRGLLDAPVAKCKNPGVLPQISQSSLQNQI